MSDIDIEKRLYAIMWPNHALVGSMLPPKKFGSHYTIGSSRYFHGQVIFAELDPNFRNDYFPIDRVLEDVKPKADGSPKRTKFISCYRVLEHLDFSAIRNLYVTSVDGKTLELEKKPYEKEHEKGFIRTYQEICPLSALVLSYHDPRQFGDYITDPDQPKSAPKVMFAQIDLNIEDFLARLEGNPFHDSPLPNIHPQKLKEQIMEIKGHPEKTVKGISLDSVLGKISFRRLRTGFWIAGGRELLYFPLPSDEEMKKKHFEFYRTIDFHASS